MKKHCITSLELSLFSYFAMDKACNYTYYFKVFNKSGYFGVCLNNFDEHFGGFEVV